MADYKMNGGRILIIPGYTAQEQLSLKDENSGDKIPTPKGAYIECQSVEYTPHIKSYEEFESAQGLILAEKACDTFAELSITFLVHQNMSNTPASVTLGDDTTDIDMNVSVYDPQPTTKVGKNKELLNAYVDPADFTDEYIKLRYEFLKRFDGRPLSIISPLFPPMVVAYLTECSYSIDPGEEVAIYSAMFREVLSTGI